MEALIFIGCLIGGYALGGGIGILLVLIIFVLIMK